MIDWGGKVATWFGLAFAGAMGFVVWLATLPHPWPGWRHDAYDALIVVAVVMFGLTLATGPIAIVTAVRRKRLKGAEAPPQLVAEIPDPAQWVARVVEQPGGHELTFVLEHRFNNINAINAFGGKRCTVIDPSGLETTAAGTALFYSYTPHDFPGAPGVRPGVYQFVWEGRTRKGAWGGITRGTYEVKPWWVGKVEATAHDTLRFMLCQGGVAEARPLLTVGGSLRCTVTDPGKIATHAIGAVVGGYRYPRHFEGAPGVRPGEYVYRWQRQDEAGFWVELASGSYCMAPWDVMAVSPLETGTTKDA